MCPLKTTTGKIEANTRDAARNITNATQFVPTRMMVENGKVGKPFNKPMSPQNLPFEFLTFRSRLDLCKSISQIRIRRFIRNLDNFRGNTFTNKVISNGITLLLQHRLLRSTTNVHTKDRNNAVSTKSGKRKWALLQMTCNTPKRA